MKTALVTGVAGGIGKAVAEILLKKGFAVCGMDVKSDFSIPYPNFKYISGDISCSEHRKKFIDASLKKFGRIDVLVNIAGVAPKVRTDILDMTEESYDFVMGINTKGTLFLTQETAKIMMQNIDPDKGAIVNISSVSAYAASPNRGEYCISKAGVSMITTLFADRLAEYGITVNEIRPGIIQTGMTATVKEKYDNLIENGLLPIKRWGMPEDIAKAVLSLVDGSLPYMTGQSINIDGGFHIRRL